MDIINNKYLEIVKRISILHDGQKRIGTDFPYVIHPIAVCEILYNHGVTDTNVLFAALLHDTLEDTTITKDEIIELTNENVYHLVLILTKEKRYNPDAYFSEIAKNKNAKLIKVADRISNLMDSVTTNQAFRKRYVDETEKYFLDLAKGTVLEELLFKELKKVKSSLIEITTSCRIKIIE